MTRPRKANVDYFPHDCTHGKTIFILESKFGNDGYAVWFKILERLGNADGHFIDLRDLSSFLHLAAYCRISQEYLIEIVDTLADLGAIDRELWRNKVLFSGGLIERITDAYRKRLLNLPTREKVISALFAVSPKETRQSAPETPQSPAESPQREREREREIKEKTQTTDGNRVEVSIRKSVEEKRQFIRDRFHFTDNEIEIEVEEIILKYQKRSPGPDVWLFISRWFKNRRDEINVREKSRTGKTGTQSHIGTNNGGNGTSGAFEEEFVDRSHLWNL